MKVKYLILTLSLSASLPTLAGTVDFYADEGSSYNEIIIKYAKKSPQVRSGDKVIGADVIDQVGSTLTPSKVFPANAQPRSGAIDNDPQGLQRYYRISLPTDKQKDAKYINTLLDTLAALPQYDIVYPSSPAESPAIRNTPATDGLQQPVEDIKSATPDFTDLQGYTKSPVDADNPSGIGGINWLSVKDRPGAQGEGITLISNEVHHWDTEHSDLPPSFADIGNALTIVNSDGEEVTNSNYIPPIGEHDTAAVGVMSAKDNGFGITGIANRARIGYAYNLPETLVKAAGLLQPGDVIQVGLHFNRRICDSTSRCLSGFVPMEYEAAWFDAIKSITDRGIIVNQYRREFHGTSAANPIVAGAAASLSGYAKAKGITLTPRQVRTILAETGTHLNGSEGRSDDATVIGTQPDLVKAFERIDALQ